MTNEFGSQTVQLEMDWKVTYAFKSSDKDIVSYNVTSPLGQSMTHETTLMVCVEDSTFALKKRALTRVDILRSATSTIEALTDGELSFDAVPGIDIRTELPSAA